MNNTETFITDVNTFDANKIKWKIVTKDVKAKNGTTFKIHRVCPTILGANGRESPILLKTDKVYSYGVSEKPKQEGEGFEYSIPLVMYDMNGPTAYQQKFMDVCDKISECAQKFLYENRKVFNKDEWILSDLRNTKIVWSKENKKHTLYAKLPTKNAKPPQKGEEISCDFVQPYLKRGQLKMRKVDPLEFRDQRCHVEATVKIECVFVGSKVTFQSKIYEVVVYPAPPKISFIDPSKIDISSLPNEDSEEENQCETEEEEEEEERQEPDISVPVVLSQPAIVPPVTEVPKVTEAPVARKGRKKLG